MHEILNEPFLTQIRQLVDKFSPVCPEMESNRMNRKLHTDLCYYLIQLSSYEATNKMEFIAYRNNLMRNQVKINISKATAEAEGTEAYSRYKLAKGLWKSIQELVNALKKEVQQNEFESRIN